MGDSLSAAYNITIEESWPSLLQKSLRENGHDATLVNASISGDTTESGAARIGIQPGDRLLGINGKALKGGDVLRKALLNLRGRPRALIVVQRGVGRYRVQVPLG